MTTLDRWRAAPAFMPSPQRVINVVAHMYNLDPDDITGPRRPANFVRARHLVCWLLRDMLEMSYPQIARTVGRVDHTTAMHAVRQIEDALDTDRALAVEVLALKDLICGEYGQVA